MSSGSRASNLRLKKEMTQMINSAPSGIRIADKTLESSNFTNWEIDVDGPQGTLYEGEHFTLSFEFGAKYPFDSPAVKFVGDAIPTHPHVYSNGHICLSILTTDWSPALSVESVCLSIVSMLASCKEKSKPPDDQSYVQYAPKNPKKSRWFYHDDSV